MSALESLRVPKSVRVFEVEGVVEFVSAGAYSDGHKYLDVRMASGEHMTMPWPRVFGGNYDYPVPVEPEVSLAARSFIVPALNSNGELVNSKRYVFADSGKLADCMTLDEYLATDYEGKPPVAKTKTKSATEAF